MKSNSQLLQRQRQKCKSSPQCGCMCVEIRGMRLAIKKNRNKEEANKERSYREHFYLRALNV